jgi:hypothetical protein
MVLFRQKVRSMSARFLPPEIHMVPTLRLVNEQLLGQTGRR